jgi:hypothetical protein
VAPGRVVDLFLRKQGCWFSEVVEV